MPHIPPEILAEIFDNSLPAYPELLPVPGTLSPLSLGQVCRYWRQTAISTPYLWRSVGMFLGEAEDQMERAVAIRLEILELWFSCSSHHPLFLDINFNFAMSPHPSLVLLLDSILLHRERWEAVSLRIPIDFLPLIRGKMPLLRELTFGPAGPPDETQPPVTLFDQAPLLTRAILTESFVPECIYLPWTQLTHLKGLCLLERECLAILNLARNLVRCEVLLINGDEPDEIEIITMPALHELIFSTHHVYVDAVQLREVLDCLVLPALRTLELPECCIDQYDQQPLAVLKSLLVRSGCSLRELRISWGENPEESYLETLQALSPSLTVTSC